MAKQKAPTTLQASSNKGVKGAKTGKSSAVHPKVGKAAKTTSKKHKNKVQSHGGNGLDDLSAGTQAIRPSSGKGKKLSKALYEAELERLQLELVKLQQWVKNAGLKVVVIFEGRDAAGKGGVIRRITDCLNPRGCRVVALGKPTERERTQWYFQRYVAHLPAAGEIVLFDRSWYNRAGVERVMGFCTHAEYTEFIRTCPEFEHMLQRSGIILIKYWFSVSDDEQERRFQDRIDDPAKRWKLSPMDLEARARWVEYSKAKDDMFAMTDTTRSPWYVVDADSKKRARLNCISHLLDQIPYEDLTPEPIVLPKRQKAISYERPPIENQTFVPERY
ncbi:MAG: polyphosphate kinase 2 [Cyanobacteria bacterium J06632_22]